ALQRGDVSGRFPIIIKYCGWLVIRKSKLIAGIYFSQVIWCIPAGELAKYIQAKLFVGEYIPQAPGVFYFQVTDRYFIAARRCWSISGIRTNRSVFGVKFKQPGLRIDIFVSVAVYDGRWLADLVHRGVAGIYQVRERYEFVPVE